MPLSFLTRLKIQGAFNQLVSSASPERKSEAFQGLLSTLCADNTSIVELARLIEKKPEPFKSFASTQPKALKLVELFAWAVVVFSAEEDLRGAALPLTFGDLQNAADKALKPNPPLHLLPLFLPSQFSGEVKAPTHAFAAWLAGLTAQIFGSLAVEPLRSLYVSHNHAVRAYTDAAFCRLPAPETVPDLDRVAREGDHLWPEAIRLLVQVATPESIEALRKIATNWLSPKEKKAAARAALAQAGFPLEEDN